MSPWWRGAGFVSCPGSHPAVSQGRQFSLGLALPQDETLWRLWTQPETLRGPAAAGRRWGPLKGMMGRMPLGPFQPNISSKRSRPDLLEGGKRKEKKSLPSVEY